MMVEYRLVCSGEQDNPDDVDIFRALSLSQRDPLLVLLLPLLRALLTEHRRGETGLPMRAATADSGVWWMEIRQGRDGGAMYMIFLASKISSSTSSPSSEMIEFRKRDW